MQSLSFKARKTLFVSLYELKFNALIVDLRVKKVYITLGPGKTITVNLVLVRTLE